MMVKNLELKNLVGCEEKISGESIFLQLADLVAGASERVLRAKSHNKNLKQINRSIWDSLRLSMPVGKWTYQLTSDSCETSLNSLWDYKTLPQLSSHNIDDNNPLRCNCGEVIKSGKIRDYYVHIMSTHPIATVEGIRCQFCNKLIPFWLCTCHDIIDHKMEPPLRGDFYGDMQKDYEVLQAVLKYGIQIVEMG